MKMSQKALIALSINIIGVSIIPILLKVGESDLHITSYLAGTSILLFYVFLVAAIASVLLAYTKDRLRGIRTIMGSRQLLLMIIVAGLLNNGISQVFLGFGTIGTNPSIAAIVYRVWPLMVALLIPFTLKQRVSAKQFLAILIGLSGTYLIVSSGSLFSINTASLPFIGSLLMAALSVSFANIIMKSYNSDALSSIALFNIASFIFLGLFLMAIHVNPFVFLSQQLLVIILILGGLAYSIGTTLYYYSMRILGPMVTGNLYLTVPFITILLSYATIGTQIQLYYIAAAALLAIGVSLQYKESRLPRHISNTMSAIQLFDITSAFASNKSPEIYGCIQNNGRALALRLQGLKFSKVHSQLFRRHSCTAFTNKKPPSSVKSEEIQFIEDIMGVEGTEEILIGMGSLSNIDKAFDEFMEKHYSDTS